MNLELNEIICRACMSSEKDCSNSIDFVVMSKYMIEMFIYCTKIKIQEDESLPPNICSECIFNMQRCYDFINMCKSTDYELKCFYEEGTKSENCDISKNRESEYEHVGYLDNNEHKIIWGMVDSSNQNQKTSVNLTLEKTSARKQMNNENSKCSQALLIKKQRKRKATHVCLKDSEVSFSEKNNDCVLNEKPEQSQQETDTKSWKNDKQENTGFTMASKFSKNEEEVWLLKIENDFEKVIDENHKKNANEMLKKNYQEISSNKITIPRKLSRRKKRPNYFADFDFSLSCEEDNDDTSLTDSQQNTIVQMPTVNIKEIKNDKNKPNKWKHKNKHWRKNRKKQNSSDEEFTPSELSSYESEKFADKLIDTDSEH